MTPSVIIATVAMGSWYPIGAARMIREFSRLGMHYEISKFTNDPPTVPETKEAGYDYTPYVCKPHALMQLMQRKSDVKLLLDASFWPIRDIAPLLDHIMQVGYYLCRNGSTVGEWASQRCLNSIGVTREQAFEIPDVSSYAVGVAAHSEIGRGLAYKWAQWSTPATICGAHTNALRWERMTERNPGVVSYDPRVKGHRHDQTVLSLVAHSLGCTDLVCRPKFTAYKGSETADTVLVCEGMVGRFQ